MGTLHRLQTPPPGRNGGELDGGLEAGLEALLGVLWVASVVRVAAAAEEREVFGVEASLAFVCLVAIPWLGFTALRRRWARRAGRHEVVALSSLPRGREKPKRSGCAP